MCSSPVVAMVWEGKEVVKTGRKMLGATNPLASEPGTIRGDFAIGVQHYFLSFWVSTRMYLCISLRS